MSLTLGQKFTQSAAKFAKGMNKATGSLWGTMFDNIEPETGLVIEDPATKKTKMYSSIGNQVTGNMKLLGLTGIGGGLLGSQVAGDGMNPDAWIGPIPLEIVTYYDFAESDSVVKYRAFGGEYFAHQGGDKNAMRIDFLMVGPYKEIIMNFLRLLRFYSKSQQAGKPLFNTDESYMKEGVNITQGEALWTQEKVVRRRAGQVNLTPGKLSELTLDQVHSYDIKLPAAIESNWNVYTTAQKEAYFTSNVIGALTKSQIGKLQKYGYVAPGAEKKQDAKYISMVPSKNVDTESIQRFVFQDQLYDGANSEYMLHGDQFYELQNMGYYKYHYNYPVIVKNMIFNNMWIETVQFTHDAKNGIDAIQGHVLLRKYMRPPKIRWSANGKVVASMAFSKEKESDSVTISHQTDLDTAEQKNTQNVKNQTKMGMFPRDKKVWVWEEKRDDVPQIAEILSSVTAGIAKAAVRGIIQSFGVGGSPKPNFLSFTPESMTSITSKVLL